MTPYTCVRTLRFPKQVHFFPCYRWEKTVSQKGQGLKDTQGLNAELGFKVQVLAPPESPGCPRRHH